MIKDSDRGIILSFCSPTGIFSVNKGRGRNFVVGLCEARCLSLCHILVEGDSTCIIRWASGLCRAPWSLADVVEEVVDLATILNTSFYHVKRSTNTITDFIDKQGVTPQSMTII